MDMLEAEVDLDDELDDDVGVDGVVVLDCVAISSLLVTVWPTVMDFVTVGVNSDVLDVLDVLVLELEVEEVVDNVVVVVLVLVLVLDDDDDVVDVELELELVEEDVALDELVDVVLDRDDMAGGSPKLIVSKPPPSSALLIMYK